LSVLELSSSLREWSSADICVDFTLSSCCRLHFRWQFFTCRPNASKRM
jgi:hypothetical protein